jgi:hypothetical protein
VAAETFPFRQADPARGALPVLDFANASTLQWPVLQGVQRYNVYRGTLQGLRSGTGYGECASTADPDLSDSQLLTGRCPIPATASST